MWRCFLVQRCFAMAVSDLFSGSLPCSAVFTMAVIPLFSGALPWRSLICSAVLCPVQRCCALFSSLHHGGDSLVQRCFAMAGSGLCTGVWHDGPSISSGAVAAGALLGTDSGGGLLTSDNTCALLGNDSGGGLLTSDDTRALLGSDSGGGLLTSDDTRALLGSDSGGGLLTSDDTRALLGSDSGSGLLTSDNTHALLGCDSGGGLLTSDDGAGGGVPAAGEDGALLRRAALTRLCRLPLALHHLWRSHS
ncbi:hypothetical protein NDU88_004513 [Pleurodeles waltl]|uniref:Uncharacterized protein n=1 Tax=Pleurodeles waltl TaxID=8319 RepID=A0AAV7RID3_PLEWA|nr:hypothetical protein NDU88_004513 [Pleurodeles waltl]